MARKILFLIVLTLSFSLPVHASARSLYSGLSGDDVRTLQETLIEHGFLAGGYDTGYFGTLTEIAVRTFQCAHNIVCSGTTANGYGVYGPRTQSELALATRYPKNPGTLAGTMTPVATGAFEFSGWVPYWRAATGTADTLEHISQLTTVMPFAFEVDTNGKLLDTDQFSEEPWVTFIASAKAAGVRVIPSILWGDGEAMHRILSDTDKRIALEDEITALVYRLGFDGIDIDFEAKKRETVNYFSTFLKGLYMRMGQKWVYCTVESRMPLEDRYPDGNIPDDATDYANDYIEMNKYCDRIEIMAYDQGVVSKRLNVARYAPYAPVADTGWVENLVRLAAQTIPRNKLIIGIPTYGYEYKVTPQNGSFRYERLWAFNPRYATEIAEKLGIIPSRTSAGELGFVYDPKLIEMFDEAEKTQVQQVTEANATAQNIGSLVSGNQPFNYVTWSDAQAIKDKVELARRLGVRGVAVFKFDGSMDPLMWDILK